MKSNPSMHAQRDIVQLKLDPTVDHKQGGTRPVVIVSGNAFHNSGVMIVVPLTSQIKHYPCNIVIEPDSVNRLNVTSEALVGHIRSVSVSRVVQKIGMISEQQLRDILHGFDQLADR